MRITLEIAHAVEAPPLISSIRLHIASAQKGGTEPNMHNLMASHPGLQSTLSGARLGNTCNSQMDVQA